MRVLFAVLIAALAGVAGTTLTVVLPDAGDLLFVAGVLPPVAAPTVLRLQPWGKGSGDGKEDDKGSFSDDALARLLSLAVPGAVSFRQQDVLDFVTERFSSAAALVGPATEVPLAASQPNITLPACTLESLSRPGSTCLVAGQAYTLSLVFAANGSLAAEPVDNVTLSTTSILRGLREGVTTPSSVEVVWEAGSSQGSSSSSGGNTIQRFTVDISYSIAGNCALDPSAVQFDKRLLPKGAATGVVGTSADDEVERFVGLGAGARRFELTGCWDVLTREGEEHCVSPCTLYQITLGIVGSQALFTRSIVVQTAPRVFDAPGVLAPSRVPSATTNVYLIEVYPALIWPDTLEGLALTLTDTYDGTVFVDRVVPITSPNVFFGLDPLGRATLLVRLSGIAPFTTYTGSVALASTSGTSAPTLLQFTTPEASPDAPTQLTLTVSSGRKGRVLVSWQPPPGRPRGIITQYELFRGPSSNPEQTFVKAVNLSSVATDAAGGTVVQDELDADAVADLDSTSSQLRVRARTSVGAGKFSEPAVDQRPEKPPAAEATTTSLSGGEIAAVVVSVAAFVASVLLVLLVLWRRHKRLQQGFRVFAFPDADDWEMDRTQLDTLHKLGAGAFGVVTMALVPRAALPRRQGLVSQQQPTAGTGSGAGAGEPAAIDAVESADPDTADVEVAVKECKVRKNEGLLSFVEELRLMKRLSVPGHDNVVRLLGVCSQEHPLMMVMEYCNGGDLRHCLLQTRPTQRAPSRFTWGDLVKMGLDIARGMQYLCEHHRFVHRDLAARNCLVHETDTSLTVKIGDMGMSRDVHYFSQYRRKGELELPIRWMSPEALADGVFSARSDVWSFGICLWEIASFANVPYGSSSNEQVATEVMDGLRLHAPRGTPAQLEACMALCFRSVAERPPFSVLVQNLARTYSDMDRLLPQVNQAAGVVGGDGLLWQPVAYSSAPVVYQHLDAGVIHAAQSHQWPQLEDMQQVQQVQQRGEPPHFLSHFEGRAQHYTSVATPTSHTRSPVQTDPLHLGHVHHFDPIHHPDHPSRAADAGNKEDCKRKESHEVTVDRRPGRAQPRASSSPVLFLVIVALAMLLSGAALTMDQGSPPFSGDFLIVSAGTARGVAVAVVPGTFLPNNTSLVVSPPNSTHQGSVVNEAAELLNTMWPYATQELSDTLAVTLLDQLVSALVPQFVAQRSRPGGQVQSSVVSACVPSSPVSEPCLVPGQVYDMSLLTSTGSTIEATQVAVPVTEFAVRNLRVTATTAETITVSWNPPPTLPDNTLVSLRVDIRYAGSGNAGERPVEALKSARPLVDASGGLWLELSARSFTLRGCLVEVTSGAQVCVAPYTLYRISIVSEGTLYQSRASQVARTAAGILTTTPRLQLSREKSLVPGAIVVDAFPTPPSAGPIRAVHSTLLNLDSGRLDTFSPMLLADSGPQLEVVSLPASGQFVSGFLLRFRVQPFTPYRITVAFETAAGIGPAWPLELVTPGGAPDPPVGLTIVGIARKASGSHATLAVRVSWQPPPGKPKGNITGYDLFAGTPENPDKAPVLSVAAAQLSVTVPQQQLDAVLRDDAQLRVRARTAAGPGAFSEPARDLRKEASASSTSSSKLTKGEIAGIITAVLVFAALVALVLAALWRRQKRLEERHTFAFPPADEWEMERARLTRIDRVGAGAFGIVHMGQATKLPRGPPDGGDGVVQVAIKECRAVEPDAMRHFAHEAAVLKRVSVPGNVHVIRLFGVCLQGSPMTLVTEYCEEGDVRQFLIHHRPSNWPEHLLTWIDLAKMVRDIARGMKYLARMGCVHCDLSCRNCLVQSQVDGQGFVVKVADFGLAQFPYDQTMDAHSSLGKWEHDDGRVPIRWMPPEILKQRGNFRFSECTDVWSFGVCIFEVVTFGATPYAQLQVPQVMAAVPKGCRLVPPAEAPESLRKLMQWCFLPANKRPSFQKIEQRASATVRSLKQVRAAATASINVDPTVPPTLGVADPHADALLSPTPEQQSLWSTATAKSSARCQQSLSSASGFASSAV